MAPWRSLRGLEGGQVRVDVGDGARLGVRGRRLSGGHHLALSAAPGVFSAGVPKSATRSWSQSASIVAAPALCPSPPKRRGAGRRRAPPDRELARRSALADRVVDRASRLRRDRRDSPGRPDRIPVTTRGDDGQPGHAVSPTSPAASSRSAWSRQTGHVARPASSLGPHGRRLLPGGGRQARPPRLRRARARSLGRAAPHFADHLTRPRSALTSPRQSSSPPRSARRTFPD